jgi:hypothetical protein
MLPFCTEPFAHFKCSICNGKQSGVELNTEGNFVGRPFYALPPIPAQRFHELAEMALVKAEHTGDGELRAEFLRLATVLHAMALELEPNPRLETQ